MFKALSSKFSTTASVDDSKANLKTMIETSKVLVLSKSFCPYCNKTKQLLLNDLNLKNVVVVELDQRDDGSSLQNAAFELTGQKTVPNIFINGKHIGGNDKIQELNRTGELRTILLELSVL